MKCKYNKKFKKWQPYEAVQFGEKLLSKKILIIQNTIIRIQLLEYSSIYIYIYNYINI